MTFVEDEFHGTLEDPRVAKVAPQAAADTGSATGRSMKRPPSFGHGGAELDRCVVPIPTPVGGDASPPFSPETVGRLRAMADAMFAAGYETECTQVFLVARRNALEASLQSLGYEKASIDDVVKMPWEALESEIATWIKAFQHTVEVDLPGERNLCARVFAGGQRRRQLGRDIFADLAHCALLHLLNFTEAGTSVERRAGVGLAVLLNALSTGLLGDGCFTGALQLLLNFVECLDGCGIIAAQKRIEKLCGPGSVGLGFLLTQLQSSTLKLPSACFGQGKTVACDPCGRVMVMKIAFMLKSSPVHPRAVLTLH